MIIDKKVNLESDSTEIGDLILELRDAYSRGENVMKYAMRRTGGAINSTVSTLIAYDLQAGSYIEEAKKNPDARLKWCGQLATTLAPLITDESSLLEVGCGEATTLAGVVSALKSKPNKILGFDISWSRCAYARTWLAEKNVSAQLFVADLFEIPFEDNSIDVVYTSHSLEPNRGREAAAIRELMRVARKAVVLIEPIYELASPEARIRMDLHGYVKGLKKTAEELGAKIEDYRLLDYCGNPLNPSGAMIISKSSNDLSASVDEIRWRCPVTHTRLLPSDYGFYSVETGLVYPTLAGIPLLRSSHLVVGASFEKLGVNYKEFER